MICCGKRLTSYRKTYGFTREYGETWEEGFKCKKCGRIRIPVGNPVDGSIYQREVDSIRKRIEIEGEPDLSRLVYVGKIIHYNYNLCQN
jgi:hypothetical protein